MKSTFQKNLLGVLSAVFLNSFALPGDSPLKNKDIIKHSNGSIKSAEESEVFNPNPGIYGASHMFYTVIINHSKNNVDIYSKNASLNWNNFGWCNGERAIGGKLSIKPTEQRTYCGGTSSISYLQHEWWFNKNGQWSQTFSEQWVLDSSYNRTRIVANNNWESAYDFAPYLDYNRDQEKFIYTDVTEFDIESIAYMIKARHPNQSYSRFDIRTKVTKEDLHSPGEILTHNSVVIYELLEDNETMNVSCYSLPLNFNWNNADEMKQGRNFCLEKDGYPKQVKY